MKKKYLTPSAEMETMEIVMMLCASNSIQSSDGSITYGGVDEDGEKDPASRRQDIWNNEDESFL